MATRADDVLGLLGIPDPSPALTILRKATEKGEEFTLRHEAMAAPPAPPHPERVPAGRRAHWIETLTGLREYLYHIPEAEDRMVGFYTNEGLEVVIDETSCLQREIVRCSLARSTVFRDFRFLLGDSEGLNQASMLTFLKTFEQEIVESDTLIAAFSSLRGTLVHDADEFLDQKARSARFTVMQRKRGVEKETETENVPTRFTIALRILPDDPETTALEVLVDMDGMAGGGIEFSLICPTLTRTVDDHIEKRLADFVTEAGFLCVRGQYREIPWDEFRLPSSIADLMDRQREMIRAMVSNRD